MNRLRNWFCLHWKEILYYGSVLAAMLFFVFLQPLGEPPDESGRYKIVQYICLNGTLPHGADPDILLYGYGGSYGFQPILTYMIQGYLLRFLFQFCRDGYLLLLAARLVNVVFGMIMAVYVRKIAVLLFEKNAGAAESVSGSGTCRYHSPHGETWGWLFCVTVMLLPQSVFLHTYVNTDSMAMMSSAIMLYAWLRGRRDNWDMCSCVTLAVGISLCALSYYNAYGFILCSMLFFAASFLCRNEKDGRWTLDWRALLQKGVFISAIVLLCIGWWFIRNAVLYNGDFLGLQARAECTLMTASEKYHPLTKQTWQNQGYSLFHMIFRSDFIALLTNSSIATFGPMSIVTWQHIYTVFKWFFLLSGLCCLMIPSRFAAAKRTDRLLNACLALCILIPVTLCVFYSYASDYQPQGRYILPMLLPFCYFVVRGVEKLCGVLQRLWQKIGHSPDGAVRLLPQAVVAAVTAFYLYALWATLLMVVFPVYYELSILYYIRHTLL